MSTIDDKIRALLTARRLNEAATVALDAYQERIFGFLVNTLNDVQDAREARSRFNYRFFRDLIDPGPPGDLSIYTWMLRLARWARQKTIRSKTRSRRFVHQSSFDAKVSSSEQVIAQLQRHDELAELARIRAQLTDDERELLTLTYDKELTSQDVSAILGVSAPAIRRRLTRVRNKLRALYRT